MGVTPHVRLDNRVDKIIQILVLPFATRARRPATGQRERGQCNTTRVVGWVVLPNGRASCLCGGRPSGHLLFSLPCGETILSAWCVSECFSRAACRQRRAREMPSWHTGRDRQTVARSGHGTCVCLGNCDAGRWGQSAAPPVGALTVREAISEVGPWRGVERLCVGWRLSLLGCCFCRGGNGMEQ